MLNAVLDNWKNSIANKADITVFEIQNNTIILDRLTANA